MGRSLARTPVQQGLCSTFSQRGSNTLETPLAGAAPLPAEVLTAAKELLATIWQCCHPFSSLSQPSPPGDTPVGCPIFQPPQSLPFPSSSIGQQPPVPSFAEVVGKQGTSCSGLPWLDSAHQLYTQLLNSQVPKLHGSNQTDSSTEETENTAKAVPPSSPPPNHFRRMQPALWPHLRLSGLGGQRSPCSWGLCRPLAHRGSSSFGRFSALVGKSWLLGCPHYGTGFLQRKALALPTGILSCTQSKASKFSQGDSHKLFLGLSTLVPTDGKVGRI